MSDLKDKILKGYIKMYFISENRLAIYGKTYELRNELKDIGAVWNPKRKRLELDEEDFKKLDNEIIEKTFELRNTQREQSIEKIQPDYDNVLKGTYGVIIYQEQIFEILNKVFFVFFLDVNSIRRAMCLKKMNEVEKARKDYIYGNDMLNIKGCINNSINEEVANKIFYNVLKSAAYTTNKSHAVGCAKIAYQMAYLKYYYSDIFKTVRVQK